MNQTIIIILTFIFLVSCGKKQETQVVVNVNIQKENSIALEKYHKELERLEEERKRDSISRHITDSLIQVASYIKGNKHIGIAQRISRIKKMYNSSICISNNPWLNYEVNVDPYDLFANEIGLLLTDANIVNYNLDSLFFTMGNKDNLVHSEDKRLWVYSEILCYGGNANDPFNVIMWRDIYNKPQGFTTSFSESFRYIEGIAYWNEIYKLNNTGDKDLYLMFGGSKGAGNNAMIVELTRQGVNLKYRGFQTKENINFLDAHESINGKAIVYNLGIDTRKEIDNNSYNNYKFNKENQTISFNKTSQFYMDNNMDTLTIGILTFNGKYFTEKLKKQKIEN